MIIFFGYNHKCIEGIGWLMKFLNDRKAAQLQQYTHFVGQKRSQCSHVSCNGLAVIIGGFNEKSRVPVPRQAGGYVDNVAALSQVILPIMRSPVFDQCRLIEAGKEGADVNEIKNQFAPVGKAWTDMAKRGQHVLILNDVADTTGCDEHRIKLAIHSQRAHIGQLKPGYRATLTGYCQPLFAVVDTHISHPASLNRLAKCPLSQLISSTDLAP